MLFGLNESTEMWCSKWDVFFTTADSMYDLSRFNGFIFFGFENRKKTHLFQFSLAGEHQKERGENNTLMNISCALPANNPSRLDKF